MIDTNTVNFAISKLDSVVQQAMPHMVKGGAAFVEYNVNKLVVGQCVAGAIFLLCIILTPLLISGLIRADKANRDEIFVICTVGCCFSVIGGIASLIVFFIDLTPTIVALKHPVIYTIMEVVK